ncbi:MAG TPA: hypothetical protein VGE40_12755 [Bacilli bacterium]
MKKTVLFSIIMVLLSLLSGCLYPDNQRIENQTAVKEYLTIVQNAVNQYHADSGVLPIKNSEINTPIYEKYEVDFGKLGERYISTIPPNAYQKGGTNYYVLVNIEKQPEVKLMDLISFIRIGEIERLVKAYMSKHEDTPPAGERVAPHFYRLDFDKLGLENEQIQSVYSSQFLGLLVHDSGKVAMDYAPEIMKIITKRGIASSLDESQDLRALLVEQSYYVPASSFPYHWINGEPIITEQ